MAVLLAACAFVAGCAPALRRYPLREPLAVDTDLSPVYVACHEEDDKGGKKSVCAPETYVSPFAWDGANQLFFRPVARFFAVDPAGEAANVDAFDEVVDSSWFVNRMGKVTLDEAAVTRGFCEGELDTEAEDGAWPIDQGKPNGANPGFRVNVPKSGKFMLKADPNNEGERATGATAIAARIYWALGFWAPCDSVVYFRPSVLALKPGLKVTDNSGVTRDFDQAALAKVLDGAAHRDELVRMVASKWLPGKTIGPFTYEGKRKDDPNDVIPHEDRRELRGARVLAAWLNHFDSREQNTMDTWMSVDPEKSDGSPGWVRHWYIDLGDCFGSRWSNDQISRRLGFAYYFDFNYVGEDFITLGLVERPWERAILGGTFGYFSARDFDPDGWRGGYPNPAFTRMVEHDAAWMARKMARFRDPLVAAAVRVGKYSNPDDTAYLTRTLVARRDIILRRYLARLSPIGELHVRGAHLCGTDLARHSGVFDEHRFHYQASGFRGANLASEGPLPVRTEGPSGDLCVALNHASPNGGPVDDDASRYRVVDIANGQAPGVLRAHLYDLGPTKGFRLVGIERPEGPARPR